MTDLAPIRRALISVSDKTGLVAFARALAANGVEILSTGGSASVLREAGVAVKEVSEHSGFPEILDGRVKTLVPQIHGGILGRRDVAEHVAQMAEHGIAPIDLVAVNLYPFEATVAQGAPDAACIENIDIGGLALIRAAAKNHDFVTVLTEPDQYQPVLDEIARHGGTTLALRRRLAGEAYALTAAYDAAIAAWFAARRGEDFPPRLAIAGTLRQTLRYGENPHQAAAFYVNGARPGVATAVQVQGKELSYNNLNDTDAAFECVAEFDAPTVAIIKHANPCGVASAGSLAEAWELALRCDPVSAFGGIVAVNRTLDAAAAERIGKIFTEVIIAPDADEAAKALLARKRNLRLLLTGGLPDAAASGDRVPQRRGRISGADAGQWSGFAARAEGDDEARPDRFRSYRSFVCLHGLQAREIECHRLCQGWRDGRHRRRTAEPRGQRAHRRVEKRGSREGRRSRCAARARQRRRIGCVLSVRRRVGGSGGGGRDGGDPARRIDARQRGDRRGGCRRHRDGVHRHAPLQALTVMASLPLAGIRVLDLTRVLSGPFCTMLLGDLGADIIKVETPGEGDTVRAQGAIKDGLSWYFANYNRNKRSITLNLRSEEARDILARLIAKSDVLVDNYRPGVLTAMGFTDERLRALNPHLVRGSITGFGSTGPYRDRPSFDFIAQAMSGFMSVNGAADQPPMRSGPPVSDLVAGLYAALGIVAGLLREGRTGEGGAASVSLTGRSDQLPGVHGDRFSGDRPVAQPHRQ